jgi:hypothetical protein
MALLRARVGALERDLAAARGAARDAERRVAELDATFDFWARLVLADVRAAAAAGAAERAQLASRIDRLEARTTKPPLPPVADRVSSDNGDPLSIEVFRAAIETQQRNFSVSRGMASAQAARPRRVFRDGHWVDMVDTQTHASTPAAAADPASLSSMAPAHRHRPFTSPERGQGDVI